MRNTHAFPVHLFPDLIGAVDPHIGLPDPLDLRLEGIVRLGVYTAQIRVALLSSMVTVARRGNLQNFADWLDPEGVTVLVYEAF